MGRRGLSQILMFLVCYHPSCLALIFFFLINPPSSPASPSLFYANNPPQMLPPPTSLSLLFPISPALSHSHPISLCLRISVLQLMSPPLPLPRLFISLIHLPPVPPSPHILQSLSHLFILPPSHPMHLSCLRRVHSNRPLSILLSILPGERYFQIGVHELWSMPGRRPEDTEPQRLLHMGRGEPQTQHSEILPQRWQHLLVGLTGSVLLPRQLYSD